MGTDDLKIGMDKNAAEMILGELLQESTRLDNNMHRTSLYKHKSVFYKLNFFNGRIYKILEREREI